MRFSSVAVVVGALVIGAATAASTPSVSITDDGIEPPIVVVPLGTKLTWRNDGALPHAVTGPSWKSPTLAPGATHSFTFRRLGSFPYRDPLHPNMEATVHVVPAGKTTRATGSLRRTYRVVASVSLVEKHVYYDPEMRATKGTCVLEEGRATRTVRWTARFANATYARGSGIEVFYGENARTRLTLYRETVSAKWLEGQEPVTPCPGGSRVDVTGVYVEHNCSANLDRKPLVLDIGWSPRTGTFILSNDGPSIPLHRDRPHHGTGGPQCGGSFLYIAALDPPGSPVAFGSSKLLHDGFSVVPRAAELAALRAGRSVRIARTLDFRALYPGPAAGRSGRGVGGIFDVQARVSIVLTPR